MKTLRNMVVVMFFTVLMPMIVQAANPADPTVFHRHFESRFDMVCHDANDDSWVFTNFPIEGGMNISLFGSVSEDRSKEAMFIFARKATPNLDIAFSADIESPSEMINKLGMDYQFGENAVGLLLSMSADDDVLLGFRRKVGDFTLFARASLENDPNPRWGFAHKGFASIDVAYREDIGRTNLQISKGFPTKLGTIIPGVRLENESGKTTAGFSIAVAY